MTRMPTFRETRSILALFIVVGGMVFLASAGLLFGGEILLLVAGAFISTVAAVAERYFGSDDGTN